jgi:hypothetical protein
MRYPQAGVTIRREASVRTREEQITGNKTEPATGGEEVELELDKTERAPASGRT